MKCEACNKCEAHPMGGCIYGGPFKFAEPQIPDETYWKETYWINPKLSKKKD